MQTSTKWLIGLGVVGVGYYFLTKGPTPKAFNAEAVASLRSEIHLMTPAQLDRINTVVRAANRELLNNASKYKSKYGDDGYNTMVMNSGVMIAIIEQEYAARHIGIS
jgi:hypothetical protein